MSVDTKAIRELLAKAREDVNDEDGHDEMVAWITYEIDPSGVMVESVRDYAVTVLNAAPALLDAADERDALRADRATAEAAERLAVAARDALRARVAELEGAMKAARPYVKEGTDAVGIAETSAVLRRYDAALGGADA